LQADSDILLASGRNIQLHYDLGRRYNLTGHLAVGSEWEVLKWNF
jgi:hypothetical protein